ncbi:hypothetical protein ACE6H2_021854 [Prunus campanulata]
MDFKSNLAIADHSVHLLHCVIIYSAAQFLFGVNGRVGLEALVGCCLPMMVYAMIFISLKSLNHVAFNAMVLIVIKVKNEVNNRNAPNIAEFLHCYGACRWFSHNDLILNNIALRKVYNRGLIFSSDSD